MRSFLAAPFIFALASAAALRPREEKIDYDGFKVYRITTGDNLAAVQEQLSDFALQPWNIDVAHFMDVAVSPDQIEKFEALKLDTSVMHEDLGADIKAEWDPTASSGLRRRDLPDLSYFDTYHSYDEHVQFVEDVQSAFSSNSEVITSGTSVEGRTITGIHLWGEGGKGSKPAILFHGTVHAREWITTMTVEYLTYQLATGYGKDANATAMLDAYDFYILPIVNPDGKLVTFVVCTKSNVFRFRLHPNIQPSVAQEQI